MIAFDIYFLDLFGTAVFAYGGASIARRRGCAAATACVLGIVSAVGGGTLRQWIIQGDTLFWIEDFAYLLIGVTAIALGFMSSFALDTNNALFRLCNNLSIAIFVSIGYAVASDSNVALPLVFALGILTGIGGGLIRDLVLFSNPCVLNDDLVPLILIICLLSNHIATVLNLDGFVISCTTIVMLELIRIARAVGSQKPNEMTY